MEDLGHPANADGLSQVEQWRDVVGYEGLYRVSDRGNLLSSYSGEWRPKAATPNSDSYLMAQLFKDGKSKLIGVHRMVAMAFIGQPPEGKPEAAHRDGKNQNNYATNLMWASHRENLAHRIEHGTVLRGESHPRSKITEKQVGEIWLSEISASKAAAKFGVSVHTVNDIRQGKRWKHVTAGLPAQPRRIVIHNKKPVSAEIIDSFRRGLSNPEVAAAHGISRNLAWKMRSQLAASRRVCPEPSSSAEITP